MTAAVSIPVRVMLRENASMLVANANEFTTLCQSAAQLQRLSIDGIVMGWVTNKAEVDAITLEKVLAHAPQCKVTFHRAFEHLADPLAGLRVLKQFKQVDKILTGGGSGTWADSAEAAPMRLDRAAAPEITILVGGGLSDPEIADLKKRSAISRSACGPRRARARRKPMMACSTPPRSPPLKTIA